MVYELNDTQKVEQIFSDWEETLIWSCLQKVMGKIFVTDLDYPKSACAYVGCFMFLAGAPEKELVMSKGTGYTIMVPQNEAWSKLIEECYPDSKRFIRYAIKKNTKFDIAKLKENLSLLSAGYELKKIDADLYDKCFEKPETVDFVSTFGSKEKYLELGRGVAVVKDGKIVAGASSYTRYKNGIEIEVDTLESERRNHLATVCCSALILNCLNEGLYPSWDAHNMNSVHLAQKLGYEFSHEYVAYEVSGEELENGLKTWTSETGEHL